MVGVQTSTKPRSSIDAADRGDRGVVEPEVPLHPLGPHVEPAVAEAEGLVDVLLVELERERRRAREDPQLVDLHLDLAGRQVRVDELRRARHDLAGRLEDELVADLVRDLGRGGRVLRVDDELDLARVVAEVDEDEPAVVAARVGPAGDRDAPAGVLRAQLAAHRRRARPLELREACARRGPPPRAAAPRTSRRCARRRRSPRRAAAPG